MTVKKKEKKTQIVYKLVEKRTRWGSNVAAWKEKQRRVMSLKERDIEKKLVELIKNYRTLFPKYRRGAIITARRNSPGIMTFRSRKDAEEFRRYYDHHFPKSRVRTVKVEGFGKATLNPDLYPGAMSLQSLLSFYKKRSSKHCHFHTMDVLAFKMVKVLE